MFSFLEQTSRFDAATRIAMFLVSTVAHLLAILILIMLPLIFVGALPEVELLSFLIAAPDPPAVPPPAPPSPARKVASPAPIRIEGFTLPREIPQGIPGPEAESPPGELPAGMLVGVQGAGIGANPYGISGSPLGNLGLNAVMPAPLPPPKPPPKREPTRIGGMVQESRLIKKVEPGYPILALKARVSGIVILDVRVDEEGNVETVRVLKGHPLLDEAAVNAVMQWKYSPTILNGEPVPVVATVTVIFKLR